MANFPVKVPALEIYRGDSFSQTYVLKDSVTGVVRDLVDEGWDSWIAQWRPFIGSPESVSFTVDTAEADLGQVTVSLTATQTAGLATGVWDLQASQGDIVRTWLVGTVAFVEDITNVSS